MISDVLNVDLSGDSGPIKEFEVLKAPSYRKGLTSQASILARGEHVIGVSPNHLEVEMQYGALGFISHALAAHDSKVSAPVQHVRIATPSHSFVIMDRVSGDPLHSTTESVLRTLTMAGSSRVDAKAQVDEINDSVTRIVRKEVIDAIGEKAAKVLLNDIDGKRSLGGTDNILVSGLDQADLKAGIFRSEDARYALLDQPSVLTLRDKIILPRLYAQLARKR
jgi:hypothetical protein